MARKWNIVESIENFLYEDRVRLTEREEMVPAPEKKKRAPARSSEQKVDSLSADNPRLQELLDTCSKATSDFVRSLDGIHRLATEIAKDSDAITKGDAEYGVRRSDNLQKKIQEFSDYVADSYSNFAAGREAMKAVASMSGLSTVRKSAEPRGSAPKKEPTNYAAMDADKLVTDIDWMGRKLATLLMDTAKTGATAKKMATDIANSKADGDALLNNIKDFVEFYLDFRDMTSGALFGLIKGFSNRLNELVMRVAQSKAGSGIMRVRAESVFQIDLSYLAEDRDFAWIAEGLHFAKAGRRNLIAEGGRSMGVIKVHSKDKKIVEGMCRSMVAEMNNATSHSLDEAGCAYAAMESLYEMYGEPDASYYGDESPYTGVQESRRFGRHSRLSEAAIVKGDTAAAQKLTTMANQFEKLVKSEMGYGSDSSDSQRNQNWLDTIGFLRDLAAVVGGQDGTKKDLAYLWNRDGYVLDARNGIQTFDGFENAKNEIKKLIKIK
jgi:hypothetical protein